MEQVMLLDGAPEAVQKTAQSIFSSKAMTIVGGALAVGILGLAAHAVYRSAYPLRSTHRTAPRKRRRSKAPEHLAGPDAAADADSAEVTLFYMEGCPHCDRMRKSLKAARRQGLLGAELYEEDATESEEAERRNIDTVPSLLVKKGGREKLFRAPDLTRKLDGDWSAPNVAGLLGAGK